jgi:uncharacterized protein with NAD-binding domain and iron-sulfur cluster
MTGDTLESFWSTWDRRPDGVRTLVRGEDFDVIIFAISLGAVPFLCKELVAHSERWRLMVERVATVQTEAFQVWLTSSLEESGWPWPPVILAGYEEPFDTWADMSHLIPREGWAQAPDAERPKSIMYFCNVLRELGGLPGRDAANAADFPRTANDTVKNDALQFLRAPVGLLWPRLVQRYPNDFRWEALAGAGAAALAQRFESQFWRANVDPSERYVQSVPSSGRYRLKSNDTGYDNLYIAGDWTNNGINAGCIEAAVVSGLQAACAITGADLQERIAGYLHP